MPMFKNCQIVTHRDSYDKFIPLILPLRFRHFNVDSLFYVDEIKSWENRMAV